MSAADEVFAKIKIYLGKAAQAIAGNLRSDIENLMNVFSAKVLCDLPVMSLCPAGVNCSTELIAYVHCLQFVNAEG